MDTFSPNRRIQSNVKFFSASIVILKCWEAIGGPTAAYPNIKAKVDGNVFDIAGFVYCYNNLKKYICRQQ